MKAVSSLNITLDFLFFVIKQIGEFSRVDFGLSRFYIHYATRFWAPPYGALYFSAVHCFHCQYAAVFYYGLANIIEIVGSVILGESTVETLVEFSFQGAQLATYIAKCRRGFVFLLAVLVQHFIDSVQQFGSILDTISVSKRVGYSVLNFLKKRIWVFTTSLIRWIFLILDTSNKAFSIDRSLISEVIDSQ